MGPGTRGQGRQRCVRIRKTCQSNDWGHGGTGSSKTRGLLELRRWANRRGRESREGGDKGHETRRVVVKKGQWVSRRERPGPKM